MFSNINKFSSGYLIFDFIFPLLLISIYHLYNDKNSFKYYLYLLYPKVNRVTYTASQKEISTRYRALMHHISLNNDPTIKSLAEIELKKYNVRTDEDDVTSSLYRVSQGTEFKINDKINGLVYSTSKDKTELHGKIQWVEYSNLEISSNVLTLKELTTWVDEIEKDYQQYLKNKMLDSQTLVEISWNGKECSFSPTCIPWVSNVTFENRFFNGKKEILEKINFFLYNESWYKERGIPYTLGILLWGEPGCGKTGFIKALMNLTKRHGIDIKLSKKMDMTILKEIICNEDITNDIIIPQNKRILLFEDIDAMGEIVKDRDLPKEQINLEQINECVNLALTKKIRKSGRRSFDENDLTLEECNTENNNLSYFLNILDGLHECPGRIIIMTTNKPEYLDKALIRPGRIDFKLNMTKASLQDIKDIFNFYWKTEEEIILDNQLDKKLSHADVVSCCRLSNNLSDSVKKINSKANETDNESSVFTLEEILI